MQPIYHTYNKKVCQPQSMSAQSLKHMKREKSNASINTHSNTKDINKSFLVYKHLNISAMETFTLPTHSSHLNGMQDRIQELGQNPMDRQIKVIQAVSTEDWDWNWS